MPDRGQRGVERGGQTRIVEADDAHVSGHVAAGLPEHRQDPGGHRVGGDEHGVQGRIPIQQGADAGGSALPAPVTVHDPGRFDRYAVREQSVRITTQAVHPA
jgi:hypothetical protein